jgi:hypothetical protein
MEKEIIFLGVETLALSELSEVESAVFQRFLQLFLRNCIKGKFKFKPGSKLSFMKIRK